MLLRQRDELLHLVALHGRRLLDEHVLAGEKRALGQLVVRRHRRRDDDRVDAVVGEHLVEVARDPRLRMTLGEARAELVVGVAQPGQLGELVEVADEVPPPVAQAGLADPHGHSFQTFSPVIPARPIALRRSTTRLASSASQA